MNEFFLYKQQANFEHELRRLEASKLSSTTKKQLEQFSRIRLAKGSSRLRDSKLEALHDSNRLKKLAEQHAQKLKEEGVDAVLKPDFDYLAKYYEERALAKELREKLQTEYQDLVGHAKNENKERVEAVEPQEEKHEIIRETGEKLEKLKQDFLPKIRELDEHAKSKHAKTFKVLLSELHSSNTQTQKANSQVQDLLKKTTTAIAGSEVELTFDSKPSVADAFTGWASQDCCKGKYDMFSIPEAHNLKVFQGGKHVGNVYVIEAQTSHGKTLHIDAIQTPLKVDMKHFTKQLVEELWKQARKSDFHAITSNSTPEYVSNHASVRQGFAQNYSNTPTTQVTFPRNAREKGFYSAKNETRHVLLKH